MGSLTCPLQGRSGPGEHARGVVASVALAVLHRALMLLSRHARIECAEITPAAGLRVDFARIKPVSAGFELADHAASIPPATPGTARSSAPPRKANPKERTKFGKPTLRSAR